MTSFPVSAAAPNAARRIGSPWCANWSRQAFCNWTFKATAASPSPIRAEPCCKARRRFTTVRTHLSAARRSPGRRPRTTADLSELDAAAAALLTDLKALRMRLAKARSVPAYVIFSDRSLVDMAPRAPTTPEAFAEVNGVGKAKLKDLADPFLDAIVAPNGKLLESPEEPTSPSSDRIPLAGPGALGRRRRSAEVSADLLRHPFSKRRCDRPRPALWKTPPMPLWKTLSEFRLDG